MDVSVVRFMDESEAEMSEVRPDLKEVDKSEVEEVERDGDIGGSAAYSAKYGWARAWLAVIRFFGSKWSIFSSRSLASVPISGSLSLTFCGLL